MFYILFWNCWVSQSLWCVPEATTTMWTSSQETSVSCFHVFLYSRCSWGMELPCVISPIMQISQTKILGNWEANPWFHARSHWFQCKCWLSAVSCSSYVLLFFPSTKRCGLFWLWFFLSSLAVACLSIVWYSHQCQEVWELASRYVTLCRCSQSWSAIISFLSLRHTAHFGCHPCVQRV